MMKQLLKVVPSLCEMSMADLKGFDCDNSTREGHLLKTLSGENNRYLSLGPSMLPPSIRRGCMQPTFRLNDSKFHVIWQFCSKRHMDLNDGVEATVESISVTDSRSPTLQICSSRYNGTSHFSFLEPTCLRPSRTRF